MGITSSQNECDESNVSELVQMIEVIPHFLPFLIIH